MKRPTKKALEAARRAELGKCQAMTQAKEPTQCSNWAVDRVNDRAYCGQHITAIATAEDEARRRADRQARMDETADAYIAWTVEHPSIWDEETWYFG